MPFLAFLSFFPLCNNLTDRNFLAAQTKRFPDHHFPPQENFKDTTDSSGPGPRPFSGSPLRPFSLIRIVEVLSVVFLCRSTFTKISQFRLAEVLSEVVQVGPELTFSLAYSPSFLSALTLPPTTCLNTKLPGHSHQHLLLPFLSFLSSFSLCKHLAAHNFLTAQTQHLPDHHSLSKNTSETPPTAPAQSPAPALALLSGPSPCSVLSKYYRWSFFVEVLSQRFYN